MKLLNLSTLLPPVPWEWPGQFNAEPFTWYFTLSVEWLKAMRAVIDCCPRSIRVHADTWMTSWENCFLCFAATWRTDLNMCVWLFRIWKVKARKKIYHELFTKKKNGEMEAKRVLDHVENVYKLQEIFTTVKLWSLCHCCERLAVSKNVSHIILLWATKDFKNSSK